MPKNLKVLVAEDELTNLLLVKRILSKEGYTIVTANDGAEAYSHLEKEKFDILLTDWMMPNMDGIELIRKARETLKEPPLIIMITALVSLKAKEYALESGADSYIAKPLDSKELLSCIDDGLNKKTQQTPKPTAFKPPVIKPVISKAPPFPAVVIGTSTGGPPTLIKVFKGINNAIKAPIFIVQHGPPWMLETFASRLKNETGFNVMLAREGDMPEPGNVYIAPGDLHLRIDPDNYKMILDDGPKENFVRPAADMLFRSAAEAFGRYTVAVVLTGLGRDGTQGANQISAAGGSILVQDPKTAVAPSMPRTVIEAGIKHKMYDIEEIGKVIAETVFPIAAKLKLGRRGKK